MKDSQFLQILIKILLFIIGVTVGCLVSFYAFNEIDPWVGLIGYGVTAVLSIYFIINQIKQYVK